MLAISAVLWLKIIQCTPRCVTNNLYVFPYLWYHTVHSWTCRNNIKFAFIWKSYLCKPSRSEANIQFSTDGELSNLWKHKSITQSIHLNMVRKSHAFVRILRVEMHSFDRVSKPTNIYIFKWLAFKWYIMKYYWNLITAVGNTAISLLQQDPAVTINVVNSCKFALHSSVMDYLFWLEGQKTNYHHFLKQLCGSHDNYYHDILQAK